MHGTGGPPEWNPYLRRLRRNCRPLPGGLRRAQQAVPDPLVRENVTVRVGEHTYVIPDANAPLVPNVGIVVGNRATLVIDPGLGRRNGEAVLREVAKLSSNTEIYVASTHYHAEHTTGFLAFPAAAQYVTSKIQQAEFVESGAQQIRAFSGRSPLTAELFRDATVFPADIEFDRAHTLDLGGVRVRFLVVGPTHTRGDTGLFVEGDRVLFSGDVVMNQSFLAANQNSSMAAWLAAFDAFEALGPTSVVPATVRSATDRSSLRIAPSWSRSLARARAEGAGTLRR